MTGIGRARIVEAGAGPAFPIGADRFVRKTGAPRRSDPFAVIEYVGQHGIPGPPPHRHRSFEEAWFILDGEVEFTVGSRATRAGSGTYVGIPRGVPHTFRVVGERPARWLGLFAPGRYVRLLEELGRVLPAHGPPDPKRIVALFRRYDTELV